MTAGWVARDEATTIVRAPREARPSHVARHYGFSPEARAAIATTRPPPTPLVDREAARFIGATIRLFEVEVLVVQVAPPVLGDRGAAPALIGAFEARFQRTIVLVAYDPRGVPTFFGPGPIAMVLARIPCEALSWRRYRYRPPQPRMLPIPVDPLPQDSDASSAPAESAPPATALTRALGRRTRALEEPSASTRIARPQAALNAGRDRSAPDPSEVARAVRRG